MRFLKNIATLVLILSTALPAFASRLDTIQVYSPSMKRKINVSVIKPDNITPRDTLPTVYLLHGYGDNHLRGYLALTDVRSYADALRLLIVIPDAETSWYFDSPIDPKCRFETFVSTELVKYIDANYPTKARRDARAVTGLSMGGHGALYLAIRHQDTFGAAGSMSGGVDFRPFPNSWDIKLRLGTKANNPKTWDANTVIAQLPKLKPGALSLIIDCGTEDFFYQVNCNLHNELIRLGIPHEFTTRPGNHSWPYWQRSLRDHMLFFNDFFHKATVEVPFCQQK